MTSNTPAPGLQALLQHAGFVRGVARALVRGDADVDDVVQATWLSVLEGGPKKPFPVRGWLATVTRRRAADLHRSRARVTRREHAAARPEATASTAELAEKAELGRRMVGAVLALDEPYRSAILLRYYEDLPPREVAQRLDVPVETARTRVKRGLSKLRDHFDHEEGGDRRAWMAAFLPLFGGHAVVPVAAAAAGTGTLFKFALAVLVLVGGFFLVRHAVDREPDDLVLGDVERDIADARLRGSSPVEPAIVPTTTPSARGTIEGIVLREAEPQSARVELRRLEDRSEGAPLFVTQPDWLYGGVVGYGQALATTTSSADGRFVFADVAAGDYEVRAVEGSRMASLRVPLRAAKPAERVRLLLPDGTPVLSGVAVHADGRPFRGWIRAHPSGGATVSVAPFGVDLVYGHGLFVVDEEGRFEVHGVSPGVIRLAAFRPGEVRYLSRPVVVPRADTFTFVVDEGVEGVAGRVVAHAGEVPIGNAVVTASAVADTGERAWARVRTGADGTFSLPLPDRDLGVVVTAPGYVVRRAGTAPGGGATYTAWVRATFGGGPGYGPLEREADGRVRCRLQRVPKLSGRVVEQGTGRARGGVAVYAVSTDVAASGAWARATSLADGSFRFTDVPAGLVTVFAASAGWVSTEVMAADGARAGALTHRLVPGEAADVVLEVMRGVQVSGRVIDARGAPIVGAAVRTQPSDALPPFGAHAPNWLGVALTDENGRFVLDPVVPDYGYRLYAQPPEGVLTTTAVIPVGPEGARDIEIHVPDAVWLTARVVDDVTGEGIANASVRAVAGRDKRFLLPCAFFTGADGRARIGPVPAVEWLMLQVRAAGYLLDHIAPATIDAREALEDEVVIRLHPGSAITGRVTAPEGISTAGLIVHVSPASGGKRRSNHPYQVRTDREGAFRVDGVVPDLAYEISTGVERGLDAYVASVTTEPGDTSTHLHLLLDVEQTAWAIRVFDVEGNPVLRASARLCVRVEGGGDATESGMVDGGSVVLRTRAPVEEAWVSVYGATDGAGVPLPAGARYRHDLPVGGGEVEIRLDTPRRIAGVVEASDGGGIPGVQVYAHPAFDPPPRWRKTRGYHGSARTDVEGAFALEGMGDGSYLLVFVCPAPHRSPESVTVAAGREDVRVVLEAAIQPRVVVRDADGTAVVGATVVAMPPNPPPGARDPDPSAKTTARGEAILPALVPEKVYRLRVDPPCERKDLATFDDPAWKPANGEIVLAFAAAITGRVVDQAGDPFPTASLLWRLEGGAWSTIGLKDDATFLIPRLPRDRTFELYARGGFEGGNDPTGDGIVRVRPGDDRVVVEGKRPVEVVVRVKDWPGEAESVMAYLLPEGGHPMVTVVQKDGTATYPNIAPSARCSFYVGPLPDGRYARTDRIVPGTKSAVTTLQQGLEIRGRLDLPAGAVKPHLWAVDGGLTVGTENAIAEDGTFRLRGLYPGPWSVRVSVNVGGRWKHADIPTRAGATDVVVQVE